MMHLPIIGIVSTSASGPPWEYASLAAAESSGDSWADGVDVTITGGATFIYDASLAVDSYSGLIHKYPWDGTGTLGTIDQVDSIANSTAQGSDPDTWSDWTKVVNGGAVADTNGGRSRLNAVTTNDTITMTSDTLLGASDNETFMIIPLVSAGFTGTDSSGSTPYIEYRLRSDNPNVVDSYFQIGLTLRRSTSTTLWSVKRSTTNYIVSTKSVATERRAWIYRKDGKWSLWFDGDATPELSGADSYTTAAAGEIGFIVADSESVTTNVYTKFHQVVTGVMSTS